MVKSFLTPVEKIFYWWGRLTAHQGNKKSYFPARTSNLIAFVVPHLKKMELSIAEQATMLSAFLIGAYKVFKYELKRDLGITDEDE